jgi:hypothetical protein
MNIDSSMLMDGNGNTEPRAAFRTTEFWVMLVAQVVSILSMTGVLTAEQSDTLGKNLPVIVGGVISIASAFGYTWSRVQIKKMRTDVLISSNGVLNAPVMLKRAGL